MKKESGKRYRNNKNKKSKNRKDFNAESLLEDSQKLQPHVLYLT
jgi:hypothetical protein